MSPINSKVVPKNYCVGCKFFEKVKHTCMHPAQKGVPIAGFNIWACNYWEAVKK